MQSLSLSRRSIILWQILFVAVGTSWLWAPHLNPSLSYRTSLISQYETPIEKFSWLFRAGDLLAGLLLLGFAYKFTKATRQKTGWLLLLISVGLIADPLFSTTCKAVGNTCQEYVSLPFVLHAIESVVTSICFFLIAVYDAYLRRKVVSIGFAIFQILYGLLFVSQLAHQDSFNTASQYLYVTSLIVWLAWYCRDLVAAENYPVGKTEMAIAKNLVAIWAFANGVMAIIISLAHIHLIGDIKGLYFTGDSAWLAQHGVVVGVVMIYLSRHLARGEARARQLFLFLVAAETLKYSVISPDADLMLFYFVTFAGLFVLRDDFDRGTIALTWKIRLRDLYVLVFGLLLATLISLMLLDRDSRASTIAGRTLNHYSDYLRNNRNVNHHRHLESALLAHAISAFLLASVAAILWVLFRPYKTSRTPVDKQAVKRVLAEHSASTEDFFKVWPADKDYFWNQDKTGFVAYKRSGSIAFVLADPIGPLPKAQVENFNEWCRRRRLSVCYMPVYQTSLDMYKMAGLETLQIGSSAVINIENFLNHTSKDKWWRWRLNKTQKSGYEYRVSVPPHSDKLIKDFKKVSDAWLGIGGHAERGFALGYFDKKYLQKSTINYLVDENQKVVAFTNQLPQFKKSKTLTIDLLRYSPGTDAMPYLLYKTIEGGAGDYERFDLGFVPFAKIKEPLLLAAKALSGDRFSAKGLEQFKNKFDPDWQPNYLAYDGDLSDLAAIAINLEKVMSIKN